MNIKEIFSVLQNYAPISLSDEFVKLENGYDNSGIIVETTEDIKSVVFSLDLTVEAVNKAIESGAKLIVTHHPAIYAPITELTADSPVLMAANNKIGIISMHLNLDVAKRGIDYYLAKGLGGNNAKILTKLTEDGTGYGRIFDVNLSALEVEEKFRKEFNSNKTMLFAKEGAFIKKAASFCGSGLSEKELNLAGKADLLISADIKHHVLLAALEMGKSVLQVTHYASEVYGFKQFYLEIKKLLSDISCSFVENEIML